MLWLRRIATIGAVIVGLVLLWFGLEIVAMFTEPEGNRIYAETWRQAPVAELLKAQGDFQTLARSDGAAGKIYRYHLGPWRGMKGRTYPGSTFNAIFGNRYMHSGVHLYTAPSHTYCDIDFVANAVGVIEEIIYSGNDCD